jgi:Ala-tRNA(Pro) deacylase
VNRFSITGLPEVPKRLIRFLNEHQVRYDIIHQPGGRATRKLNGRGVRQYAAVVIVRSGNEHLVTVVPMNCGIDVDALAQLVGQPVRLETEEEFKWLFPDCSVAAIPPFGNLYGLSTLVDNMVSQSDYLIFPAGTDTDYIKISYPAYARIVQPQMGSFAASLDSIGPSSERPEKNKRTLRHGRLAN